MPVARAIGLGLVLVGCSGPVDGGSVISVGGTYQTAVSIVSATCVDPTVQQHPTTVTHAPGATQVGLTHAGSGYSGTLNANGSFVTTTATQIFGNVTYRIDISGQFSLTGMVANVTVTNVTEGCNFIARWAGPKDGPPNVIP